MDEVGFPLTPIDADDLERMSAIFATKQEAADFFGVSLDIFEARLNEEMRLATAWLKGRAMGRLVLRQAQLDMAMGMRKGSAAMMIWLGKQSDVLAQEERPMAQTKNVNVSVRYLAEWGGTPRSLGQEMDGEEGEIVDGGLQDAVPEDAAW